MAFRWRSWLLVIVCCAGVAGALGFLKFRQIQAAIAFGASFPEPVEAVEVIQARQSLWQPTTMVTGELVATRSVDLRAEAAGMIQRVGFAPGARVTEGQLLLAIDAREEEADLAAARADLKLAELDLDRAKKLIATGATTTDALDRAQAGYDSATAQIRRIQALIAKKRIVAPFDAAAGLHSWEAGQFMDKGTDIVSLVGLDDKLWVDFTLPQQQASRIAGDSVRVYGNSAEQLPNRSTGDAVGSSIESADAGVSARIIARDASINALSRNIRFRAEVDNTALAQIAGGLARVAVSLGQPLPVTLVPVTAVRRDSFGARVFVLVPAEEGARSPDRAALRNVALGEQIGNEFAITDGLRAGERVAATGAFKLRDGALVQASAFDDERAPDRQPDSPGPTDDSQNDVTNEAIN